jgi:hypothetical protein
MRLIRMTIYAIKMEWYFFLYVRISKWENCKWGDKFYYHAHKIKELVR